MKNIQRIRNVLHASTLLFGWATVLAFLPARAATAGERLENANLAWVGTPAGLPATLKDKRDGMRLQITGECFQVLLGQGQIVKASDFERVGPPQISNLAPEPNASRLSSHFAGRQMTIKFFDQRNHLAANWSVILRQGSSYLQQKLELRTTGGDVWIKEIVLFEQPALEAKVAGSVDGSPVLLGDTFFCGYEHPMAHNVVSNGVVRCSYTRNAVLKGGETLAQSLVIGAAPPGQLRRGFLEYIERERAHPYRPFLHYNSWYDIAWIGRKFNEAESLDKIRQFGDQLVHQRGVAMRSFLFDDGWDDNRTLWQFHSGFPNGFTPLKEAANDLGASISVWISPWGGYADAKVQRLAYGAKEGFETTAAGFSMAGPNYYGRFRDMCLQMVRQYGVNMFKFDGLAAHAGEHTRDGDAMLRLIGTLRTERPDIYINQTVGTWPSPFWLLYVDSTWRAGDDHSFYGKGSDRQQWITYRDMQTYNNVVQRGPLYPLNSIMLHGIIYATNAEKLTTSTDADFADEVHEFFGTGTQLQEMYVTPTLLDQRNWDDLAEAAKWSRANSDVLVDTHWIGGNPGKGEIYGWASWTKRKGILTLRNPDDQPAAITADIKTLFEIPSSKAKTFHLHSPWKGDKAQLDVVVKTGQPHAFNLAPFETLVLETH